LIVEGKIMSAHDLRIDGKVEGPIEFGNHGLILGAGAAVKAHPPLKSNASMYQEATEGPL
jgi:hypothetical protein